MLLARTEHRKGIDPACVGASSVCPFHSPSGERPPTGETGLLPLLLRRREVRCVTGLRKSSLYRSMSAGLFPFPFSLGPETVRWLLADALAYPEGLLPRGHISNGQGQKPEVANYPAGPFLPMGIHNVVGPSDNGIAFTFTKGQDIVPTAWAFPLLIREIEVIRLLAWSRTSLQIAIKAGLFPEPVKMGQRTIGWHIKAILAYVQNLPLAWHTCLEKDRPHSLGNCPAAGRTNTRISAFEVVRKTVPHVRSEAA